MAGICDERFNAISRVLAQRSSQRFEVPLRAEVGRPCHGAWERSRAWYDLHAKDGDVKQTASRVPGTVGVKYPVRGSEPPSVQQIVNALHPLHRAPTPSPIQQFIMDGGSMFEAVSIETLRQCQPLGPGHRTNVLQSAMYQHPHRDRWYLCATPDGIFVGPVPKSPSAFTCMRTGAVSLQIKNRRQLNAENTVCVYRGEMVQCLTEIEVSGLPGAYFLVQYIDKDATTGGDTTTFMPRAFPLDAVVESKLWWVRRDPAFLAHLMQQLHVFRAIGAWCAAGKIHFTALEPAVRAVLSRTPLPPVPKPVLVPVDTGCISHPIHRRVRKGLHSKRRLDSMLHVSVKHPFESCTSARLLRGSIADLKQLAATGSRHPDFVESYAHAARLATTPCRQDMKVTYSRQRIKKRAAGVLSAAPCGCPAANYQFMLGGCSCDYAPRAREEEEELWCTQHVDDAVLAAFVSLLAAQERAAVPLPMVLMAKRSVANKHLARR